MISQTKKEEAFGLFKKKKHPKAGSVVYSKKEKVKVISEEKNMKEMSSSFYISANLSSHVLLKKMNFSDHRIRSAKENKRKENMKRIYHFFCKRMRKEVLG